jgi:hypothetical protein
MALLGQTAVCLEVQQSLLHDRSNSYPGKAPLPLNWRGTVDMHWDGRHLLTVGLDLAVE